MQACKQTNLSFLRGEIGRQKRRWVDKAYKLSIQYTRLSVKSKYCINGYDNFFKTIPNNIYFNITLICNP